MTPPSVASARSTPCGGCCSGKRESSRSARATATSDFRGPPLDRQRDAGAAGPATRLEVFVASGGPYVYGSHPDIDGLFREQAGELDRKRREAMLHRIQQLIHEKAMYAPISELDFVHAQGPRVAESSLGLSTGWAFSAPYEDMKLKGQ